MISVIFLIAFLRVTVSSWLDVRPRKSNQFASVLPYVCSLADSSVDTSSTFVGGGGGGFAEAMG